MPTVAEQLRAAREAQNLTIIAVAEKTKIRTDHIRAVEEGNYGVFSAPIYIRGTVKNYANLLKLDPGHILSLLDAELNRSPKFSDPPSLRDPAKKTVMDDVTLLLAKLNLKAGLAKIGIAVILLLGTMVGWLVYRHKPSNPVAGLPPAVYQPARAGDTLPLPRHK